MIENRRQPSPRRVPFRPAVEALEDRCTPSRLEIVTDTVASGSATLRLLAGSANPTARKAEATLGNVPPAGSFGISKEYHAEMPISIVTPEPRQGGPAGTVAARGRLGWESYNVSELGTALNFDAQLYFAQHPTRAGADAAVQVAEGSGAKPGEPITIHIAPGAGDKAGDPVRVELQLEFHADARKAAAGYKVYYAVGSSLGGGQRNLWAGLVECKTGANKDGVAKFDARVGDTFTVSCLLRAAGHGDAGGGTPPDTSAFLYGAQLDYSVVVRRPQDVKVTAAYSTDAKSVTVEYEIKGADVPHHLYVELYRSLVPERKTYDPRFVKPIGVGVILGPDANGKPSLHVGKHRFKIPCNNPLVGTAEQPYLFVALDPAHATNFDGSQGAVDETDETNNFARIGELTAKAFHAIVPHLAANADRFLDPLNRLFGTYGIITYKRQAAFLAQAAVETFRFLTLVEGGYISNERRRIDALAELYGPDGRYPNPNVMAPKKDAKGRPYFDLVGPYYYGRGFLMLSVKGNYAKASKVVEQDLVKHPDLIVTDSETNLAVTGWYWTGGPTGKDLNAIADQVPPDRTSNAAVEAVNHRITRVINVAGIQEDERLYIFERGLRVLRPKYV